MKEILFPGRPSPDRVEWLTPAELAERWRFARVESVYRIAAHELPYFKRGRNRLYRLSDVETYEREHMEAAS